MLSRRVVLFGGLVAGASGWLGRSAVHAAALRQAQSAPSVSRGAPMPRTKVNFDVPPGATDCAVHVFDPGRFPYREGRSYTPEPATVTDLRPFLKTLRLDRVVVVQATPYGTDNACVVDSVRQLGSMARGVVTIDEKTPEASLDEMHRAGVRGIRHTLNNVAVTDPDAARQRLKIAVDRLKTRKNWSLQITAVPATFEILREELMAVPVPLVVDHFGEVRAAEGVEQRGFGTIVELVKAGKAYVKISHADNLARQPDMSDMTPFALALINANPQRIVWGTAWPHPTAGAVEGRKPTDIALHRQADDGRVMNMLPVWVPDAAMRKMILVDNAARLYNF
jgi:predicted TIM-barrel fold metal-dependent hydrolase